MEAVIFIGLQASGKSSFYKERFFRTHVRISQDLLRTRHREHAFLRTCLDTQQRFVVDKTNATRVQRDVYITAAKDARFHVAGYYFRSSVADCLRRNASRPTNERVPDVAILGTAKQLQLPAYEEGFNELFTVRLEAGRFVIEEWSTIERVLLEGKGETRP
jgi:predicted kinase